MSVRPSPAPGAAPLQSCAPARLPLVTPFADRRLSVVTDIGPSGLVETSLVYRLAGIGGGGLGAGTIALGHWEHTPAWLQMMCGDPWDHASIHRRVVSLVRRGDLPGSV